MEFDCFNLLSGLIVDNVFLTYQCVNFNYIPNCGVCRRVVQPWLGLRIGSLQAEKLSIREEIHDTFPHTNGVYVKMVNIHSMQLILSSLLHIFISMTFFDRVLCAQSDCWNQGSNP